MEKIKKTSKILVVDDLPANAFLLENLLKLNGFENIVKLTDSKQVVRTCLEWEPDLLLLDLKMPDLDGFEILERLNALKEDDYLSVIVITAQDQKDNRIKALKLGAKDFIGKPFDPTEVLMRVSNMLEIRHFHNNARENNRLLEEKVQERTRDLENSQMELVEKLLRAAEFRDNETGNHILRIGKYCEAMAKLLNFEDRQVQLLSKASMMHDIGKIGIPDHILLKPGPLSDAEMTIMKKHSQKGAEILKYSQSEVLRLGETIALTHHEKWDGSGYPQGLKGEEIPLEGRITAIFDVFDALLSERPYKSAWELDDVLFLMKKESGSHFDPNLMPIFLKNLTIFLEIWESFLN